MGPEAYGTQMSGIGNNLVAIDHCDCCGSDDEVNATTGYCHGCSPHLFYCESCGRCDLCCDCMDGYDDEEM